jgi:type IV secretory pathway VirD2 relaxase
MANHDDDRFRPTVASPRAKGSGSARFVSRVLKAASEAGPTVRGQFKSSRLSPGAKRGRGYVAATLVGRRVSPRSRRVTIKSRLVNLRHAVPQSTRLHLRYLERDGVALGGDAGRVYDGMTDSADSTEFERRGRGDRHQFRFIVSAEEAADIGDLKPYIRTFMSRMERDLGTRLEWVAVDHWDTEHPHTHVVLRGKDQNGRDLIIAREYISHGMRARARELATEWLGPRTQREIDASLQREVNQERWTSLDASIRGELHAGALNLNDSSFTTQSSPSRSMVIGRLNHLAAMGLAESTRPSVWRVRDDASTVLHAMAERGDIIRTMQRAMGGQARAYDIFDPAHASQSVTGRIVAKGLHDELHDRGYVILDGLDGRVHYAALSPTVDFTTLQVGAMSELCAVRVRASDRNITTASKLGVYRTEDHLAALRSAVVPGQSPEAVVEAHVRRLEALRRHRIVERISEGVWQIPADLPERGRAHDLQQAGGASVEMRCHLPLEQQVGANGATWLDQQLIKGSKAFPSTELGAGIRQALGQREDFLVTQGLARRSGQRVILAQNLLATLRDREIAEVATRIEAATGLLHRPAIDGARVAGTYRESLQLTSGRFAMLDDGVGFSLVPWRPVIEKRIGQQLGAVIQGSRVSWEFGRSRTLSL